MLEVRRLYLVAGKAEGNTPLNAFDNALLAAGIGDVNLIKVSSIVPPGAEIVSDKPRLPRGALVPCVYSERVSTTPGERIAVALAVGLADDGFGVVMESEGESAEEACKRALSMVADAFQVRALRLARTLYIAVEHRVERCGSVVAACVYWQQ
ncbi:Pyruvoyl-dependent arginine decarboxylase [bacterium HR17]|uniref:Pyruvoyl-dependent arginine decarboxylase AaxB n=1 Tax=Candidatus Fervidibacter japonicus TaxID=2035412 RepID=A0A2H5X9J0_9BACT|nr:Pyruvoyl-dependent arginine decarboxylase [bacterium HR17]